MNNSKIAMENIEDEPIIDTEPIRRHEQELHDLIQAVDNLRLSNYWKFIVEHRLNGELQNLINQLKYEREPITIYRLQGRIEQAEKLDFDRLSETLHNELTGLQRRLYGRD